MKPNLVAFPNLPACNSKMRRKTLTRHKKRVMRLPILTRKLKRRIQKVKYLSKATEIPQQTVRT
jgi:hypothetical protein